MQTTFSSAPIGEVRKTRAFEAWHAPHGRTADERRIPSSLEANFTSFSASAASVLRNLTRATPSTFCHSGHQETFTPAHCSQIRRTAQAAATSAAHGPRRRRRRRDGLLIEVHNDPDQRPLRWRAIPRTQLLSLSSWPSSASSPPHRPDASPDPCRPATSSRVSPSSAPA